MDRRRYLRSVAAVGGTLAIAGCIGDDDGSPTPTEEPTDTPTPTAEPTETPTPTEEPTETPTPTEAPPDDPDQLVIIPSLEFDPSDFEIVVGDTVLWDWQHGGHNLKYDDGDVPEATSWEGTEGSRTTTYGRGHKHWHTFEVAGEYEYYCVPHRGNGMVGRFTVTE